MHVHLQVLTGDITTEKTEAVVVFRSNVDSAANGDSQRLLRVAGRNVDAEYQQVKSRGGISVARGVVHTGAGDLDHPEHIFHFNMEGNNRVKFRDTLMTTLRCADSMGIRSLAFPSLYHDNSAEDIAKTMVESISEFTLKYRPMCLHFIQIVITDDRALTLYPAVHKYKRIMRFTRGMNYSAPPGQFEFYFFIIFVLIPVICYLLTQLFSYVYSTLYG